MDGDAFFQALRDLDDGALLKLLDGSLAELVEACRETGGNGRLSLVVEVKKCGRERMVKVKPKVSVSVPRDEPQERILYADESGRLCTEDPAQGLLDLDLPRRVVPSMPPHSSDEPDYAAPAKVARKS